jgi:hypothetical protein
VEPLFDWRALGLSRNLDKNAFTAETGQY